MTVPVHDLLEPLEMVFNRFCKTTVYEGAKFRSINAAASLKRGAFACNLTPMAKIPQH